MTGPVHFTSLDPHCFPGRHPDWITWNASVVKFSAEPASVNAFGWLKSSSLAVQGRIRDNGHPQGLPKIEVKTASAHEQWQGYLPGLSMVQQRFNAIDFASGDEAGTRQTKIECVTPETDPKIPSEGDDVDRWIPPELRSHIKESDIIKTVSRHPWIVLRRKPQQETIKPPSPNPLSPVIVTYDAPDSTELDTSRMALLEIMQYEDRSLGRYSVEGLVLLRQQDGNEGYKRIGFFKTEALNAFDGADVRCMKIV